MLAGVKPESVSWSADQTDLFGAGEPPPPPPASGTIAVPRAFLDLARSTVCHRDPERFALLYALLWRLQAARGLMEDHADPLVRRCAVLAKEVRRDIHKMRAFLRFREMGGTYVAWFEPDHHIVRANAGFFIRRFASMKWSILTPSISLYWDGKALLEGPGMQRGDAPAGDPIEEVWKTYYASTFNPARVKIGAMLKEMPKKYWKNMPETALIPALVATAQARETGMMLTAQQRDTSVAGKDAAWAALRDEAAGCTRCPLHCHATQTVFGEGPMSARMMMIGEQPGDQEDLAGRPFVGPAGQVFDRALGDAEIDRAAIYVSNAVKHFKFEQRGKRRIHAKPVAGEIEACRWWIDQERAILAPTTVVALGATAARSLFDKVVKIGEARGRPLDLPGGGTAWVTAHPSSILRIEDAVLAAQAYRQFVDDLRAAHEAIPTDLAR